MRLDRIGNIEVRRQHGKPFGELRISLPRGRVRTVIYEAERELAVRGFARNCDRSLGRPPLALTQLEMTDAVRPSV
ncbi:MAG TPA: hypothetical protein VMK12_22240 [Anaeromyxobacteraceae bacterium]|nr:hypothetical protein [Anaeromyxobacteraceae bacterium]